MPNVPIDCNFLYRSSGVECTRDVSLINLSNYLLDLSSDKSNRLSRSNYYSLDLCGLVSLSNNYSPDLPSDQPPDRPVFKSWVSFKKRLIKLCFLVFKFCYSLLFIFILAIFRNFL